jgi:hypothetical protein
MVLIFAPEIIKKITNLQNNGKNNEGFEEALEAPSDMDQLISFIKGLFTMYALYLAFKCKKGFDLSESMLACCCSTLYIAYRMAVPCK